MYFPYTYPPIAATNITNIGDTPSNHIDKAQTIGIQQLDIVIFALCAILNVGTAIKATTAGRLPLNIAVTTALSLN